jgi:hypothetical protein
MNTPPAAARQSPEALARCRKKRLVLLLNTAICYGLTAAIPVETASIAETIA